MSRRFLLAAASVSVAAILGCSDPVEPAPTAAPPTAVATVSASASAAPRTPPTGCPKMTEALGMRRGFPAVTPQSKAELEAAIAELELRSKAFDAVKAELDPETQAAGAALTATFAEFVVIMRRKAPPATGPDAADTAPPEATERAPAAPKKKKPVARPSASAAPSAEPLYDTTEWSPINERYLEAWKAAAALCPAR